MNAPFLTITDVLAELDRIVEASVAENDLLGVFAYVYRRTTAQILDGIRAERFDDGPRMERFDVVFAKRYIDAYRQFRNKEQPARSWAVAFAARRSDITILQHLLLGMNAHINFDLGLAAAEVAPGESIFDLREDFMRVNDLLEELTDEMQARLSRVSRLMILLDWVGGRKDEVVVNFSIRRARGLAWRVATQLAFMDGPEREKFIRQVDESAATIGSLIHRPPGRILGTALRLIRFFETRKVDTVIRSLA